MSSQGGVLDVEADVGVGVVVERADGRHEMLVVGEPGLAQVARLLRRVGGRAGRPALALHELPGRLGTAPGVPRRRAALVLFHARLLSIQSQDTVFCTLKSEVHIYL